jgi:hemoglobin-like flavoprotein
MFDEFVFNQEKMKELLGDEFQRILKEIVDLLKQNLNNLKTDYDFIYEKMKEENPALKQMFTDFERGNKITNSAFS